AVPRGHGGPAHGATHDFPAVVVEREGLAPHAALVADHGHVPDFAGRAVAVGYRQSFQGAAAGGLAAVTHALVEDDFLAKGTAAPLGGAQFGVGHRGRLSLARVIVGVVPAVQPDGPEAFDGVGHEGHEAVLGLGAVVVGLEGGGPGLARVPGRRHPHLGRLVA